MITYEWSIAYIREIYHASTNGLSYSKVRLKKNIRKVSNSIALKNPIRGYVFIQQVIESFVREINNRNTSK